MEQDNKVVISAMTSLDHETLKLYSYENKIARQLRDEVIGTLARGAGMDTRTFMDFIQFLSEDPELQARFVGWRAKRRITG